MESTQEKRRTKRAANHSNGRISPVLENAIEKFAAGLIEQATGIPDKIFEEATPYIKQIDAQLRGQRQMEESQ